MPTAEMRATLTLAALGEVPGLLAELRPLLVSDAATVGIAPYIREMATLQARLAASDVADRSAAASELEDAALRLDLALERGRLVREWDKIEARAKMTGAAIDAVARVGVKLLTLML